MQVFYEKYEKRALKQFPYTNAIGT